ncbi:CPXCG motif-containing cysteine-rich protein [Wenzhouxiangella sediminis]|uniref:CPXCG motif-containing cysteine-rich protein n=1 Tax=Wenzhouxiangella sediminis TaxID=1792836 RepID=A0A3E1KCP0_9GAMM|nr:CPXCG motif-containing cysteine-rich protein [Wenzhouxiangella sediminis]
MKGGEFGFACPCCGEPNELFIDPEERGQVVVMDCRVCCRPIEIALPLNPDEAPDVRPEDQ